MLIQGSIYVPIYWYHIAFCKFSNIINFIIKLDFVFMKILCKNDLVPMILHATKIQFFHSLFLQVRIVLFVPGVLQNRSKCL